MGERILVHPTVELDLGLEYTDDELLDSDDLQSAIDSGYLTVVEKSGYPSTTLLGLSDTPTTYSGSTHKILRINDNETGVEYHTLTYDDFAATSILQFNNSPNFDGEIHLLGWYIKTDTAVSLSSGSPITANNDGFHSHFIMDASSVVGAPFTVTVSGVVVDEVTGVYSQGGESITISGSGYYQTVKSFIDAPEFSIVEGSKSCNLDIYKSTYWDFANQEFTVTGCRFEWTPDHNNWGLELNIYHHLSDGSLEVIDSIAFDKDDTYLRAADSETGKYKRIDYDTFVDGAGMEGLILTIDQSGIGDFYFELRYIHGGE
jgi:hypothetical protein